MLRPVPSKTAHGSIATWTNYQLEGECLGLPIWLQINGHDGYAREAVEFIARQPEEMFVRATHRALSAAYLELAQSGLPSTRGRMKQLLSDSGWWSDDEEDRSRMTPGYLDEIAEAASCKHTLAVGDSPITLLADVTGELRRLRKRRELVGAAEELHRIAREPGAKDEYIQEALGAAQAALNDGKRRGEITTTVLNTAVAKELAELERQAQTGEEPPRITTGFPSLDRVIVGFEPGNLVVVAARTSMGKTSFALDLVVNAAENDFMTFYASFEMFNKQLVRSIMSRLAGIPGSRMLRGDLEPWQLDQLRNKFASGCELPIVFEESNLVPDELERKVREINRLASPASVDLLVIDHIQLMGTGDKTRYQRRDLQLAAYSGQLKDMAKRLGLVVVCLSQLNRQSATDQRPPRLSDLRESGAIEQDSDMVLGIYRRHMDTFDDQDRTHGEVHVLKNRGGPVGYVPLLWAPELAKFVNPDSDAAMDRI